MPFGPPVGGWLDAEGQVLDASVFDFGPRTDIAKAADDAAVGTENDLSALVLSRSAIPATSKDLAATRQAHSRAWVVTRKLGDSGTLVAAWQAGAAATPGVVYSYSTDGMTWTAPAQVSSRTGFYPSLMINPNTNDIFVLYAPIASFGNLYARVLPYTGVPGTPSWGAPTAEITVAGGGNVDNVATLLPTLTGLLHALINVNSGGGQFGDEFSLNAFDSTSWNFTAEVTFGSNPVWMDIVQTAHFATNGQILLTVMNGGQFHIYSATLPASAAALALTQRDTFFASCTEDGANFLEQYSTAYNEATNQLCLAYINGTALTYKVYSWNGTTLSVVTGPTVIENAATCHAPLVQADASGNFYIVWLEDLPSATQRKIRVVSTADVTHKYELMTDSGSNTWMWLDGPRTTDFINLLQFMVAETANVNNNVLLVTVPISVFKTAADSGTGGDVVAGVEVSFGDTGSGVDSPSQTKLIAPGTCQDGRTILDGWVFDTAQLDDTCIPNDVAETGHAVEVLNSGPQILESVAADDQVSIAPAFDEPAAADDEFGIDVAVDDTAAAVDVVSLDQEPQGDKDDTGAAVDDVSVEVLADDSAVAVEDLGIAPDTDGLGNVTDAGAGAETLDLQTTDTTNLPPDDTATAAEGDPDIGVEVDDVAVADDTGMDIGQEVDEAPVAVEGFDILVEIDDTATGTDSDPSQDGGISKDVADTGTAADLVSITRDHGVSVRIVFISGHVKMRFEGNRQPQLGVRN